MCFSVASLVFAAVVVLGSFVGGVLPLLADGVGPLFPDPDPDPDPEFDVDSVDSIVCK